MLLSINHLRDTLKHTLHRTLQTLTHLRAITSPISPNITLTKVSFLHRASTLHHQEATQVNLSTRCLSSHRLKYLKATVTNLGKRWTMIASRAAAASLVKLACKFWQC